MERSIAGGDLEDTVDWRTQIDDIRWQPKWVESPDDEPPCGLVGIRCRKDKEDDLRVPQKFDG